METLDRGSDLQSQLKDLLSNYGPSRTPATATAAVPMSRNPGRGLDIKLDELCTFQEVPPASRLPRWRVYEPRFGGQQAAAGGLRVGTPPAISSRESDWDPSYGFLSPQLGARNLGLQRRWIQPSAPGWIQPSASVHPTDRSTPVGSRKSPAEARSFAALLNTSKCTVAARSATSQMPTTNRAHAALNQSDPIQDERNARSPDARSAQLPRRVDSSQPLDSGIYSNSSNSSWVTDNSTRPSEQERTARNQMSTAATRELMAGRKPQLSAAAVTPQLIREMSTRYQDLKLNNNSPVEGKSVYARLVNNQERVEDGSRTPSSVYRSPCRQVDPSLKSPDRSSRSEIPRPVYGLSPGVGRTKGKPDTSYSSPSKVVFPARKDYKSPDYPDYGSPLRRSPMKVYDYSSPTKYCGPKSPPRYRSPMKGLYTDSPHKYEEVSNSSQSPTKYEVVEAATSSLDITKSDSYEFIQNSNSRIFNKVKCKTEKPGDKTGNYAESRETSSDKTRDLYGETRIYSSGLHSKSANIERSGARSGNRGAKSTEADVFRRSWNRETLENIYTEPSRLGLGPRAVTQVELGKHQIYADTAELGKPGDLGPRIPRLPESRIPRLNPADRGHLSRQLPDTRNSNWAAAAAWRSIAECNDAANKPANLSEQLNLRRPETGDPRESCLKPVRLQSVDRLMRPSHPAADPTNSGHRRPANHVSPPGAGEQTAGDLAHCAGGHPAAGDQRRTEEPLNLTLKKGILWSQRKRLFSRWKEKYFILTPDYLQCYKKAGSRVSEMGSFIYKVRLTDIEKIDLEDRKGYYTINLTLKGEDMILLRKTEAIMDWYLAIHQAANISRERRKEMLSAREFWNMKQFTDTESMQRHLHVHSGEIAPHLRGMYTHTHTPCSTPSPSPRLTSLSPLSPIHSAYLKNNSPLLGEMDSGIDSLLTSLSDTSSNYSHRRIISPR